MNNVIKPKSKTFINKLSLVKLRWNNMVQALITINNNTNRVLNVIKAKFALKDKSKAIEFLVNKYIEEENEPELRPEFIEKMKKIEKQKSIRIGSMANFKKRYGLK